MRMLDYSIWSGSIVLEAILLYRAFRTRLRSYYPVFYIYIFFVLTQSVLRLFIYHYQSRFYPYTYWLTEFLGVALGCAVVFEIYRVALGSYPGTARMARRLLALIFVGALAKAIADATNDTGWWAEVTTMDIERAMRTVQALGIAALAALFLVYSIPFARNLKGILLGYGLFIGASVMWFTFAQSGGERFRYFWSYLNPASYDVALCLWVVYLWSPALQPVSSAAVRMEEQYQQIASRTRRRLADARGYLAKVMDR